MASMMHAYGVGVVMVNLAPNTVFHCAQTRARVSFSCSTLPPRLPVPDPALSRLYLAHFSLRGAVAAPPRPSESGGARPEACAKVTERCCKS